MKEIVNDPAGSRTDFEVRTLLPSPRNGVRSMNSLFPEYRSDTDVFPSIVLRLIVL